MDGWAIVFLIHCFLFLIIPWLYEIVGKTLCVCVCFDKFTPVFKPKTGSDSELDMLCEAWVKAVPFSGLVEKTKRCLWGDLARSQNQFTTTLHWRGGLIPPTCPCNDRPKSAAHRDTRTQGDRWAIVCINRWLPSLVVFWIAQVVGKTCVTVHMHTNLYC